MHTVWEGGIKLHLFTDEVVICKENPKESLKQLKLVSDYSEAAGFKINISGSAAFGTSLVVKCLSLCLPMQGVQF